LNFQNIITNLITIKAPWNKTVTVQNIHYVDSMNMLRLRIQEGKRFTDLELDLQSLKELNAVLTDWLNVNPE